jgi:hypothetical protein
VCNSAERGLLAAEIQQTATKRKRAPNGAALGDQDVKNAFGAPAITQGTVLMFSLSEGGVVAVLEGERNGAVKYFMFGEEGRNWSCSDGRKLIRSYSEQNVSLGYIQCCVVRVKR